MYRYCGQCGTPYAWDLTACPNCGSTETVEEADVPKTTVGGGASNAWEQPPEEQAEQAETPAAEQPQSADVTAAPATVEAGAGFGAPEVTAETDYSRVSQADVRAWARSAGLEVSDTGRVPNELIGQYLAAQQGE